MSWNVSISEIQRNLLITIFKNNVNGVKVNDKNLSDFYHPVKIVENIKYLGIPLNYNIYFGSSYFYFASKYLDEPTHCYPLNDRAILDILKSYNKTFIFRTQISEKVKKFLSKYGILYKNYFIRFDTLIHPIPTNLTAEFTLYHNDDALQLHKRDIALYHNLRDNKFLLKMNENIILTINKQLDDLILKIKLNNINLEYPLKDIIKSDYYYVKYFKLNEFESIVYFNGLHINGPIEDLPFIRHDYDIPYETFESKIKIDSNLL